MNLIVVAEGDEERMDIGLRKWVKDHPELLEGADAMYLFGGQSPSGGGGYGGGSEGCVYVELTTSGKSWGRGPLDSDIHGSNKRGVDSPAWRHIKMLASLVSDDGNTPLIDGFFDEMQPITPGQNAELKEAAAKMDMKVAAENLGVARFMSDDPFAMLKTQRYGTSFNLDGIWGGNMYAGGAGAILPNKITSKHNFRYVPNMTGPGIVKKLRAQLDKNGYKDVDVKLIGDVPWAKMNSDTDLGRSMKRVYEIMNINHGELRGDWSIGGGGGAAGGYWPAYMFGYGEVGEKISPFKGVPIIGGGAGLGGRAHAANEYYVIEGAGKVYRHGRRREIGRDAALRHGRQDSAEGRGDELGLRAQRPGLSALGSGLWAPGMGLGIRDQDRDGMIAVSDLEKEYHVGDHVVHALRGITLSIGEGEFVTVVGPSGSGKSTFMHILGCLDRPTRGAYQLGGRDVSRLPQDELARVRNETIGFVFQGFNLLARTSAIENVELPLLYTRAGAVKATERRERARRAIAAVGLSDREEHHPNQLSGGQQQRVAIARALVNSPRLLLADEPTGNLDTATSQEVMEVFARLRADHGITVLVITHERDIAAWGTRTIDFRDGRVVSDVLNETAAAQQA